MLAKFTHFYFSLVVLDDTFSRLIFDALFSANREASQRGSMNEMCGHFCVFIAKQTHFSFGTIRFVPLHIFELLDNRFSLSLVLR